MDEYSALAAQEIARRQGDQNPPAAFGADTANPNGPGPLGGFIASAFSGLPELFGAPPSAAASAFRKEYPIAGFVSEMGGMMVPYVGAEMAISRSARLAGKVDELATGAVRGMGFEAAESPVLKGMAREIIVNAPIEASRVAIGTTQYDQPIGDMFADAGLGVGIAGLVGAAGGALRKAGSRRPKAAYVEGQEIFLAPNHQLDAIENGAKVVGRDAVEFANELEDIVLKENPGYGGIVGTKKPLDYYMGGPGQTADETGAVQELFRPEQQYLYDPKSPEGKVALESLGEEANIPTGFNKQYLVENATSEGSKANLKPGELGTILPLLGGSIKSIRDVARNFQYPRILSITDKAGAQKMARLVKQKGWTPIAENTWLLQERNGGFVTLHKFMDGTGRKYGKGAGGTEVGARYFIGKTTNPGVLVPKAAKLSEDVTARWAKWAAPFQEGRTSNIFSQADDALLKAVTPYDYNQIRNMDKKNAVGYLKEKFGKLQAEGEGLLDSKLGFKDSRLLQDMAEETYLMLKPTMFLEHQNSMYGRMFGFMKNGQRVADNLRRNIMHGKQVSKAGTSLASAIRGKNSMFESGFNGHRPVKEIIAPLTEPEVNLIVHLANANKLSPERAKKLVKEGVFSPYAAKAVEELRAINEDVLNDLVLPVFNQTGHASKVEWLKNHLGIPKVTRGDNFTEVRNENGDVVHMAFGRNGSQVEREAKTIVDEAAKNGRNWTYDKSKLRTLPTESEQALQELQRSIDATVGQNAEEGEIIYRGMRRLAAIKGTTGKKANVPISSGILEKRGAKGTTSADVANYKHEDLLNAMDGHLSQLLRFTAMQNWQERFGGYAAKQIGKNDPKMYDDLMRKSRQFLGIEGPTGQVLNRILAPVFGSIGGNQSATRIAAAVNKTMYAFTLGFVNPSFAILNLLTPLQTVAPWIMHMRTAPHYEAAKMMQFTPRGNALGKPAGVVGWLEPMKVLGESMRLMRTPTPELRELFDRAINDGVFHPQLFEEWVGKDAKAAQSLGDAWRQGGMAGFLMKGATWMGEESEKMSRLVAWNASYKVGKEFFGLEGDQLYRFMRRANEVTMFNYHTVDRSKLFTGPLGSMFGLFKNWQMHFMGNMMQYAGLAVNHGNFGPLLWAGGAAAAMGGLGATPLVAIADGIGNWHNDANSSFLWMEQNYGPDAADALYFGLPAFAEVSLQSSSSIPGTDVRNEVTSLFSFAMGRRVQMFAKAWGAADEFEEATGRPGIEDPRVRDMLFGAALPRAFVKAISATEGDYVRSMSTGDAQVRGLSPLVKFFHGAGFNMVDVERYQDAAQALHKSKDRMASKIAGLGRGYQLAEEQGDGEEMQRIIDEAILSSVPLDRVMTSAATRARRAEGDILSKFGTTPEFEARMALQPQEPPIDESGY